MTRIKQHNQMITTHTAANEAQQRLQDWIAAHAGKDQAKAKKSLTTKDKYSTYDHNDLLIESVAVTETPISRRCSVYSIQYQPKQAMTLYSAHALVIFPHDVLGNGAVSVTVHQPDNWTNETPPWAALWKDPTNDLEDIITKTTEQELRQQRKRKPNGKEPSLYTLQDARQVYGPLLFLTPTGKRDTEFLALLQDIKTATNVVNITEAEQLSMSSEIPDVALREWLTAKAVLIKDSYESVPDHHPIISFTHPHVLRPILESLRDHRAQIVQDMAQRSIIRAFLELLNEYHSLRELTEETQKNNPEQFREAAVALMTKDLNNMNNQGAGTQEKATITESDAQASRAIQRISTLEDQLKVEQTKNKAMERQLEELQSQVKAYEEYMATGENELTPDPEGQQGETDTPNSQTRDDIVMEAITQPGRFPHIRFLNTTGRSLSDYGKARPTGQEIIGALDAINSLAELYFNSENGNVGSWNQYFHLPGWTYANSESDATMGKFPKSRTFQDHEQNRQREVQRHLTYRGSHSGLEIFFDTDGEEQTFVVAYIGEHLPYASNRS